MDECWAKSLGDCEGKLSREHLISKSLFDGAEIQVFGLPWCPPEGKVIGIDGLAAKILCRLHNNRLSEVDQAGGEVFKKIKRFLGKVKSNPREKIKVDGSLLERWLLKTAINICCNPKDLRVGKDST